MNPTPEEIIDILELEPLPMEGGFYRQTYVSSENIMREHLPNRYSTDKPFGTAIYYLLTSDPDSFSALHKLPTDEVWHFYLGDPVEVFQIHPNGDIERVILGQDIFSGQTVQNVVHADVWQGARLLEGGEFGLMGTTMGPGFTPEDYCGGVREDLLHRYPQHADLIKRLTRTA